MKLSEIYDSGWGDISVHETGAEDDLRKKIGRNVEVKDTGDDRIEVTVHLADDDDPKLLVKILQPSVIAAVEDNFVAVIASIEETEQTDKAVTFMVHLEAEKP